MRRGNSFLQRHLNLEVFLVLLLMCIISLGASGGKIQFRPAEAAFNVFSVFQRGIASVGDFFSGTINSISELTRMREAYEEVKDQLEEYQGRAKNILQLELENEQLRTELNFTQTLKNSFISAEIIAKDPINHFDGIIINKGSRHGVVKDLPVVAFSNGLQGLVGRIVEVGPLSSKIQPLFDESSFVASRLQKSRYEGLIQGHSGDNPTLIMSYVKKRARGEIQFGDYVVTSGMNSLYPKDIYIGTLKSINGKEWETSLQLELTPIVDFSKLEYVYLLLEEGINE